MAIRVVNWLQKALGYSLTGVTTEKAVFICWGRGDNGKTTMLATFRRIIEEYSSLLQIDTLMVKREETTNSLSDLADLRGCRFVQTSETEEGQRIAEGKLKRISQGIGNIKTCRKYENPIEFPETHKLWIDANHRPAVRGSDNAIWNRLFPIPFTVTIPKQEQDPDLGEKLFAEAQGILAWAVEGAVKWYKERLGRPEEVSAANADWRADSDPLKDFLEDCCELGADATCKSGDLWSAYEDWAEHNGEKNPLGRKKFNARLQDRGCVLDRDRTSRFWTGISLTQRTLFR